MLTKKMFCYTSGKCFQKMLVTLPKNVDEKNTPKKMLTKKCWQHFRKNVDEKL
jgi:hypothetical protein